LEAIVSTERTKQRRFEGWVGDYSGVIFHVLRGLGLDGEQAQEATQEVFFQAWKSMASFEGRSKEKTWLVGIAIRVGHKYLRKDRRESSFRKVWQRDADVRQGQPSAPELLIQQKQKHEALHRVIGQLSDKKRTVFVLFYLEELTVSEIAEALSWKAGTVRSTLQRAKEEVTQLWHSHQGSSEA
jgi:RNA polymerase sigma-70 factor (ECF subfamily)